MTTASRRLKLLFVNPCLRRNARNKLIPVGLGYVMTYVTQHGYEDFDLLDVDIDELTDAQVEEHLETHSYDVVLFGSIVTHYKWIKWLTQTIRRIQPEARIVVGNSVAGSCADVFMEHTAADVAVIGEGERTCLAVLDAIRDGTDLGSVLGIAYRTPDGRIVKTPPRRAGKIDDLPLPDWSLFDTDRYVARSQRMSFGVVNDKEIISMPVASARGCVFRCTFCHFVFVDDPYRHRTPANVIAEIRRDVMTYGCNYINFWDDLSFASVPQTEAMVDAILESGLEFEWSGTIRADLLGKPKFSLERRVALAKKMYSSGCRAVGFSLESANREILAMMEKHIEPEYFATTIEILREAGITANTSVVFGYPLETPETIRETFAFCLKNRVYPSIGFLLPLPQTPMYEYAKKRGLIVDEDRFLTDITERQDFCLNMTSMEEEEVMSHIKEGARMLNDALGLGLSEDRFIRTGGEKEHTNKARQLARTEPPLDPDAMKRNENDFSFNYSEAVFDIDLGTSSKEP